MKKILLLLVVVVVVYSFQPPIGRTPGKDNNNNNNNIRNTCSYYSTDEDANQLGLLTGCSKWCTNYFGRTPDGVNVNVNDGEPYKCCTNAHTNEVVYGDLTPIVNVLTLVNSSYVCTVPMTTKTWSVNTSYTDNYQQTTNSIVPFDEDVPYAVEAPSVFADTFKKYFDFDSHQIELDEDKSIVTFTDTTSVEAVEGCTYTYTLTTSTTKYRAPWHVPICLDGYCRCNYNKPIEDPNNPSGGSHYLWYVNLLNFAPKNSDRCINQKGDMNSLTADTKAKSTITYSPPSCAP